MHESKAHLCVSTHKPLINYVDHHKPLAQLGGSFTYMAWKGTIPTTDQTSQTEEGYCSFRQVSNYKRMTTPFEVFVSAPSVH